MKMGSMRLCASLAGGVALGVLATSGLVHAAQFEFHGDMNNRFQLYSDQRDWFNGSGLTGKRGTLKDSAKDDNFAEIKYRFWAEAATDNNEVRGVYAVEIGGVRFGEGDGGDFSGDGTNVETRWAYVDFGFPDAVAQRVKVGLQPVTIDHHLWQESALGVMLAGPASDATSYQLLWARGDSTNEDAAEADDDGFDGADNFALNLSSQLSPALKGGAFALYQTNDQTSEGTGVLDVIGYEIKAIADNSKYDIWSLGVTGDYGMALQSGKLFAKGTAIYQTGDIEGVVLRSLDGTTGTVTDHDLSAYFLRGDLGMDYGNTKVTYTIWYSSGDDDAADGDLDAFIATDVDVSESMIFQENMTDDDYFAETPYLLDKGYFFNRLQVDHKLSTQVTLTGMAIYNMLAEKVTLGNGSRDDALGIELGGRLSYKPYSSLEIAAEVAYLFADDAMDAFEESALQNGRDDEDILHAAARVRYKF